MPYIDPTGTNPGWSDTLQEGLGLTQFVEELPPREGPVPGVVTRFQARMALRHAGLFDQVDSLMSESTTPIAVVEAWESAQEFRRDSVNVQTMAAAVGIDNAGLDDLFIAASKIQA